MEEYLRAIAYIKEDALVIFPKIVIDFLANPQNEPVLISPGCAEHLYCAIGPGNANLDWHYNCSYDSHGPQNKFDIYKTCIPRPLRVHVLSSQCADISTTKTYWLWRYMDENQGCASWFVLYDTAASVPDVLFQIDGDDKYYHLDTWDNYVLNKGAISFRDKPIITLESLCVSTKHVICHESTV